MTITLPLQKTTLLFNIDGVYWGNERIKMFEAIQSCVLIPLISGCVTWLMLTVWNLKKAIKELSAVTSGYISVDFGDTANEKAIWTTDNDKEWKYGE